MGIRKNRWVESSNNPETDTNLVVHHEGRPIHRHLQIEQVPRHYVSVSQKVRTLLWIVSGSKAVPLFGMQRVLMAKE
jgi:hypothetical protein